MRMSKIYAHIQNICVHQKLGAQTLTIWARQNLQLLTSSKSGWRALWRCLLEPRMWTTFFLRCKKIPICWFFVKFFPIFVIKTMFYGLDLDPDFLWSKKRLDPYGIWIQPNAWIRIVINSRLVSKPIFINLLLD